MKTVSRFLSLLLVLAMCSCIFPTRLADENPYGSQSIGFIRLNKTIRADISATLGAPVRVFSNGRWWLYQSDRRMSEWFWFFCAQTGCGGDEFGGAIRLYSLFIEFGDDDIVRNLTVVTDKRPCSKDNSLCYANGELRVAHSSRTATKIYRDESPNAPVSDGKLQALRGEETARYSATLESGISIDLVERGGLVFDVNSMEPFTGRITRSFDEIVGTFSYKAGLLHGPMAVREGDGSVLLGACFEHGTFLILADDGCAL